MSTTAADAADTADTTMAAVSNKEAPTYSASFNKWCRVMHSLLSQLAAMYNNDDKEINIMLQLFTTQVMSKRDNDRRDAALLWHASMASQYQPVKEVAQRRGVLGESESKVEDVEELAKRELAVMAAVCKHPLMAPVGLVRRYHELDEKSKDSLWLHVFRLNTHALATREAMATSDHDMAASATEKYMAAMPPQWRERFMRASAQFGGQMPASLEGWRKGLGAAFAGATGDEMLSLFNAATSQFGDSGGMMGMQSMMSAAAAQAGPEGAKTMQEMGTLMTSVMATMGNLAAGAGAGAGAPASTSTASPMMTPAEEA